MNVLTMKVQQAYENWFWAHTPSEQAHGRELMTQFWRFIDSDMKVPLPSEEQWPYPYFCLSDTTASKVEMLLSPHHETIIKAYYIRKDHGPQDNNS